VLPGLLMVMKKRLAAIICTGTLLFLLFYPLVKAVAITDATHDGQVLYARVNDQEELMFQFTHSVNKRPVYEYLRVDSDQLVVTRTRYDSFGAGMPTEPPPGAVFRFDKDGMLEITGINLRRCEIGLFVGTVAEHSLTIRGRQIKLADLVKPGDRLRLQVTTISLMQLWLKGRSIE
jgi:hypothetical protein